MVENPIGISGDKLSEILVGLGQGISILDRNMRIYWVNKELESWAGKLKEIKGKHCYEVYQKRPNVCSGCPSIKTLRDGKIHKALQKGYDKKRKQWRTYELTTSPIKNKAGKITHVVELAEDVTENIEREEKLRELKDYDESIVNNIETGIISIDKNGIVKTWNHYMEEHFKIKAKSALGRSIFEVNPWAEKAGLHDTIRESLRTGKSTVLNGVRFKTLHLGIRILDHRTHPLKDKDGNVTGAVILNYDLTERSKMESELSKIKKREIHLTQKEKLCFYGLVRWPNATDKELSKKLKLPLSTITTIRNKLKKQGYYQTFRIPDFRALGCELINIGMGVLKPQATFEKRSKIKDYNSIITMPEIIFMNSTDKEILTIQAIENFTRFNEIQEMSVERFKNLGFFEKVEQIQVPSDKLEIYKLFDYSCLLKQLFGINLDHEEIIASNLKKRSFTKKEKTALYGMVKYPELNDTKLAKKINISRQTISSLKKRFIKEGVLKTVNIPDISKLDCEILAFSHAKMGHNFDKEKMLQGLDHMCRHVPVHLLLMSENDSFSAFISKNYEEFDKLNKLMEQSSKDANLFSEPPKTTLIPIKNIKVRRLDFAPLTKKMLGL